MNAPLPLRNLFETHLTVRDLSRSIAFYRDIVGLPLAAEIRDRGAAFFWIPSHGQAMLGLWSIGSAPIETSFHIAFGTSLANVMEACDRLRSAGVTPLSFFATETAEPSVIAWMPAAAVYFRDPDGHLLEYIALLDAPPRPELEILPWPEWERLRAGTNAAAASPYTISWHQGPRTQLRGLFELADDSPEKVDRYIDFGRVLVASDGDEIVGHLQLVPDTQPNVVEIKSLAVHEGFRRRGIGRRLVDHALAVCRVEQLRRVTVTTAMADIDTLRFYQRRGFRASAILRDAFTPDTGYPSGLTADGIPLRDGIRFDLEVDAADAPSAD
jgi:ribosomal protein S18 acetylase RimI-like enzyme